MELIIALAGVVIWVMCTLDLRSQDTNTVTFVVEAD